MKQLFDLKKDPNETHDCAADPAYAQQLAEMEALMISQMHGIDLEWIEGERLVGFPAPEYHEKADYGLYNQRGYHWPTPSGYESKGKNA